MDPSNTESYAVALVEAAQAFYDAWRRNPLRGPLDRAIEQRCGDGRYSGIFTGGQSRTTFRQVVYAIKANMGHGYTNPGPLLDIVERSLGPEDHLRVAVSRLTDATRAMRQR